MIAPRGRHALEAVALVASAPPHSPVTISVVAHHIGMSMSYTENLLKMLKLSGILRSVRGPGGGYQMGRHIADLNAWDVMRGVAETGEADSDAVTPALGETAMVACLDHLQSDYAELCRTFLQNFPMSQLVDVSVLAVPSATVSRGHRGLRPLPKPQRPRAPCSVFEWSDFMGSLAA